MSLRVAKRLEAAGQRVRVIDLRWLSPLPVDAVAEHVEACGDRLLIVDECRARSGIANELHARVADQRPGARIERVQAPDTYIPLGVAANLVLISEADIERAALGLGGAEV